MMPVVPEFGPLARTAQHDSLSRLRERARVRVTISQPETSQGVERPPLTPPSPPRKREGEGAHDARSAPERGAMPKAFDTGAMVADGLGPDQGPLP